MSNEAHARQRSGKLSTCSISIVVCRAILAGRAWLAVALPQNCCARGSATDPVLMLGHRLAAAPQASKSFCYSTRSNTRSSPRPFTSSIRSGSDFRGLSASPGTSVATAAASRRHFLAASGVLSASARRGTSIVMAAAAASSQDLLIVGPGVLGSYLGVLWKEQYPNCTVTAQTNTTNSHDR
jgi:hypothetical protein